MEDAAGPYPVRLEVYGLDREPRPGALLRVEDVDEVRTEFPATGASGATSGSLRYRDASKLPIWEMLAVVDAATGAKRWVELAGVGAFRLVDPRDRGAGYRVVVKAVPKVQAGSPARPAPPAPASTPAPIPSSSPGPGSPTAQPGPGTRGAASPEARSETLVAGWWLNPGGVAFHVRRGCPFVRSDAVQTERLLAERTRRPCRTCGGGR